MPTINPTINGTKKSQTLYGTKTSDRMFGFRGDDTIDGGHGHDMIVGGEGDDHLFGGSGRDTIYGGADTDYISGGVGADEIVGGLGADVLRGGGRDKAVDTFVFRTLHESTAREYDQILDFEGGIDKIDLSAIDANIRKDGNQRFTLVRDDRTPGDGFSGKAGDLSFWESLKGTYVLSGDVDGDRRADFKLVITVIDQKLGLSDIIL